MNKCGFVCLSKVVFQKKRLANAYLIRYIER